MPLCKKCGVSKDASMFFASNRAKNGIQTYCKPCQMAVINAKPELRRARSLRYRQSKPAEAMYRHLVKRATRLGVPCFEREVFCAWFYQQPQMCAYCGETQEGAKAKYKHALHIDRKDGSKGYSAGNLCLACQRCNMVKSGYLTHQQMLEVAGRYFGGPYGNAHEEQLAALKALDDFWTTDYPEGPVEGTKTLGGLATLHQTTIDIWRQVRAAIAKTETKPSEQS